MSLETTYGLYEDTQEKRKAEEANLSKNYVLPLELMSDWRQCSVVSDFVAKDEATHYRDTQKSSNVLSTITNELLENAVKFSYDRNKLVTLTLHSYKCSLSIETVNTTQEESVLALRHLISDLETKDIETLYFEQLEKTFESEGDESGLGFLGLIKDFNLNLGIKIKEKTSDKSAYDVYVKVEIDNEKIDEL